ncbi:MAG TPA: tetratricopeptide repeat protein [Thermoanaerobaculaceae bacterium]|nr:tetratricopeptide repeat protein [Thermoanaerobaculaceae bacterium]HRS15482.1 tetratricopeptide repeat protein [Thermoanaerobaculaceae bacterium]
MLNFAVGSSYEEAEALNELAWTALDAFIDGLKRERFVRMPPEIAFDHADRRWTLVPFARDLCSSCGVWRDVRCNGDDESMLFAFCPMCWDLDVELDGKRLASACRNIKKVARDIPPDTTAFLMIGDKSFPLMSRAPDPVDPPPANIEEYAERAEAAFETGRQLFLARRYWKQADATPHDDEVAAYWFGKAAESGHTEALQSLAFCYATGRGVARDDGRAVALYRQAAERGSAVAMAAVGDHYNEGLGVARDPVAAAGWYRLAAHSGNAVAQRSYGLCLLHGKGVPPNREEALVWLHKAAKAGDPDALAAVADLDPAAASAAASERN